VRSAKITANVQGFVSGMGFEKRPPIYWNCFGNWFHYQTETTIGTVDS